MMDQGGIRDPAGAGLGAAVVREALRVPVLHKLWLANAAVVFAAAMIAGSLAARADDRLSLWAACLVAAAGGGLIHLKLLRLALRPVTLLVRTAEQVAGGDEGARAPASALADPELAHLVEVFNAALDSVSLDRNRLRDLAARAQDAQEAERVHVARALHDGTIQTLSALLVRLRLARRMGTREERDAVLDSMRDDLVEAIEIVRRAARALRPAALSELGVERAVEGFAAEACAGTGIALECRLNPIGGALGPEAATAVYRVVQEAIDNAIRHGRAASLRVSIGLEGGWVRAEVADDGCGFEVAETMERGRCLGLFAMEQRVARAGGEIRVESEPGRGTRVEVRVPARVAPPLEPVLAECAP